MKLGEHGQPVGELWGLPVVVSNEVPKGEIIFGYFPSAEEILADGCTSLEEWIKKHPKRFCKVTGLEQ